MPIISFPWLVTIFPSKQRRLLWLVRFFTPKEPVRVSQQLQRIWKSQCQFTILGTRSCDIDLAFLSLTSWTTCIFIRCLLGKGKNWLTYSILETLGATLGVITWIIAQLIWINLPCKSISLEDLLQMPCFLLGDNETTLFCNFGTCYCKYFCTYLIKYVSLCNYHHMQLKLL